MNEFPNKLTSKKSTQNKSPQKKSTSKKLTQNKSPTLKSIQKIKDWYKICKEKDIFIKMSDLDKINWDNVHKVTECKYNDLLIDELKLIN